MQFPEEGVVNAWSYRLPATGYSFNYLAGGPLGTNQFSHTYVD